MRPRFSAANPAAEKVRVLYTSESVIYEGMPVCYDYDATLNIDGYDNTDGAGITTDEGHQNEGKFTRVTDPEDNALMHFAGVVAGSDKHGVTGDGATWIDIYIPNGAVVPVRCDVDTTAGVTLLAITVDSQEFGQPISGTSRVVALAMETEDALGAGADITLAKLDTGLSIYQNLDGTSLSVGAGTSNLVVNEIRVESDQTSGTFCALYVRSKVTAGGYANSAGGGGIIAYLRGEVSDTPVSHVCGVHINFTITGGTPAHYISALHVKLHESGATMTSAERTHPLRLESVITDDPAGYHSWMFLENNATAPDFLFDVGSVTDLPGTKYTGAYTLGTNDYGIKVNINGVTWYIPLTAALA